MIYLWRGGHSPELLQTLHSCWKHHKLLILCPDQLQDFSFLSAWPEAQFIFCGDWTISEKRKIKDNLFKSKSFETFSAIPQLGVFTSGTSSGQPRLVLYSRQNVLSSLTSIREVFQTQQIRKIFCYPRPTHTFGLVLGYLQALLFQHELVVPFGPYSRAAHSLWVDSADNHTLTLGVPTHFYDLIRYVQDHQLRPRSSYSCIVGGGSVSVSLWDQLQTILNVQAPSIGYGATECSPGVTHLPPGRRPTEDGELGSELRTVKMHVSESGATIQGPNVAMAFYEAGRWLQPTEVVLGDRLQRRSDGILIFKGRTTDILNRGGVKHSLEQIEQTLIQKCGHQLVCAARPDTRLGNDLAILGHVFLSEDERHKILQTLWETYQIRFDFSFYKQVNQLPLNDNGKLDRKACNQLLK